MEVQLDINLARYYINCRSMWQHQPINGKVFAPRGSQRILIGNKSYISVSPSDYIDIDLATGKMCVRNFYTGCTYKVIEKGEEITLDKKYLKLFIDSIKEKFKEV